MTAPIKNDIVAQGAFNVLKKDLLTQLATEESKHIDLAIACGIGISTPAYLDDDDNYNVIRKVVRGTYQKTERAAILLQHSQTLEEFLFLSLLLGEIERTVALTKTLPYPFNTIEDFL